MGGLTLQGGLALCQTVRPELLCFVFTAHGCEILSLETADHSRVRVRRYPIRLIGLGWCLKSKSAECASGWFKDKGYSSRANPSRTPPSHSVQDASPAHIGFPTITGWKHILCESIRPCWAFS